MLCSQRLIQTANIRLSALGFLAIGTTMQAVILVLSVTPIWFSLTDEQGNHMYAEIPLDHVKLFEPLLDEGKIYQLKKFVVAPPRQFSKVDLQSNSFNRAS